MSVDPWFAALTILAVVVVIVLLWRLETAIGAARQARESADRMDAILLEQQRALLSELHESQQRLAERIVVHGTDSSERLRSIIGEESGRSRDAMHSLRLLFQDQFLGQRNDLGNRLTELSSGLQQRQDQLRTELLGQTLTTLSEHARADRQLLQSGIERAAAQLAASMEVLTRSTSERLEAISGHVNERLDEGFKKTNETFTNVMTRLATIDEAQKKIDGLTTNVVSLQELLGDKRARGAFGEVQLEALVRNILPPGSYEFQYTLPNNSRADCVLKLPEPTGMVAVDSKFPLENYHRMFDEGLSELERKQAQNAFRADVRRHIDAISAKYLIPNLTSDGAVMFVPAEAVFAEIHAYHAEVVAHAMQKRVWIVSPTTLMAVLNTARAVLKDVETRRQIHVIKDALGKLAKDFARFDERMQRLAVHIDQANRDVQEVQTSSKKISGQFARIEQAELDEEPTPAIRYRGLE
jgi:DNA recombination protein RmuC